MTGHPKGLLDTLLGGGAPTGTLVGLLTGMVGYVQTHDGESDGSEARRYLLVV